MAGKGKAAAAAEGGDAAPKVNRRGELAIELGGVKYNLRPSFAAIEAIEEKVAPLDALVTELHNGRVSVAHMAVMTAELMKAHGTANPDDPLIHDYKGANPRKLAELIYEAGAMRARLVLGIIAVGALSGGYTAQGEAKPAAEKKGETPGAGSSD